MELDDEGVRDLLHDVSLNLCVGRLIRTDNEVFLKCFHSIDPATVFFLCHEYFAEGASADDLKQLEVID